MALITYRARKADLVIFSEQLRVQMMQENPPLIRHRWSFIRGLSDVFLASEVVAWASRKISISFPGDASLEDAVEQLHLEDTSAGEDICGSASSLSSNSSSEQLTPEQAIEMFQKLLDAGVIKSATEKRKIEFQPDKSFYRFAVDEIKCDNFIRSIVLGYRLYKCASESKMFKPVCSSGKFVSAESLTASQIVTWMCEHEHVERRELASNYADHMLQNSVITTVHYRVDQFADNSFFYIFSFDFAKCNITSVAQVLAKNFPVESSKARKIPSPPPTYESFLKKDGSVTKNALLHPEAPFFKRELCVAPDNCGYGFCVRGDGPCFIKIVDPDSPAGKAGVKEFQYVANINGKNVLDMSYVVVENLIVDGPGLLEMTLFEKKDTENVNSSPGEQADSMLSTSVASSSSDKFPSPYPSPQSWTFNKPQGSYTTCSGYHMNNRNPTSQMGMR